MTTNLNLRRRAKRRLVEFERYVFAQIGPALRACTTTTAAEDIATEKAAENVAEVEVLKDRWIESTTESAGSGPHTRVPKLVVALALIRVHQDRVRLTAFLESLLRVRIIRIAVRVILEREFAIRALDLGLARGTRHAEYFVIVTFGISGQSGPLLLS